MIKLVLVRHGQSMWNLDNKFTGWTDVDLSPQGEQEAIEAGKNLSKNGYIFDIAYTSTLKRANETLYKIMYECDLDLPIIYSWRLNERHYGALQGLNKKETAEKYGDEQVHIWRRSADVRPPLLEENDPLCPKFDPKYKDVDPTLLPRGECLLDCLDRVIPIFENGIKKSLKEGKRVIVVAHGNSIRSIVMHLEKLSKEDIMSVEIPTGKPLIYELDDNFKVINKYYL